jgi:RHS repeat-associated protein
VIEACQRATARASWASSLGAGPVQVSIDPNGNLTTKTEGTDNWTYTWNAENQLVKVEKDGVEQARFSYDPLERRVEKIAGGVTTNFTYDGEDILREARGTTVTRYVQGLWTDEPLEADDGTIGTFFHADALGSVVRLTNTAGAVALTREYDAWGVPAVGASEHGYAFTGREWDPESGLYYYRARYYDTKLGRFISEDPVGFLGGADFYAYVSNDPGNSVDPSGLLAEGDAGWECLVCTVYAESRGQPPPCQKAVATVILNRWDSERRRNPKATVCDVVSHGFDGYGNSNYRRCMDPQNTCPEEERTRDKMRNFHRGPFGGPNKDQPTMYFGNADPKTMRKQMKYGNPVPFYRCPTMVFYTRK